MKFPVLPFILLFAFFTSCSEKKNEGDPAPLPTSHALPSSITLLPIAGGSFTMGGTTMQADAPEVSVTVSAFEMGATEVTNAQYLSFLNEAYTEGWILVENKTTADPCGQYSENMVIATSTAPFSGEIYLQLGESGGCTSDGHSEHINNKSWISFNTTTDQFELIDASKSDWPINWLKWYGAKAFTEFYGVSLPTEAQWEYAARGGAQLDYPTDNGSLDDSKANYNGDVPGVHDAEGHSVAVASYPANPFGLYDMGGNVWEWCEDYYAVDFYSSATDPVNTNPGTDGKRVRRGGSWNYHSATLLTYARAADFENRGNNHFGFRVVKN